MEVPSTDSKPKKKKGIFGRIIKLLLLALLLGAGAYIVYLFLIPPSKSLRSIYLVPEDAIYILEIDNPYQSWTTFTDNHIWEYLKTNHYLREIAEGIDAVNEEVQSNRAISEIVGSRPVMVSVHKVRNELDYLIIVDLANVSKLKSLTDFITPLLGNAQFNITRRDYHDYEIIELYDSNEKETVYAAFVDNLFLTSYTHLLIEAAIDQKEEPRIGRDLNFLDISDKLGFDGLMRIYFQHRFLDDHWSEFFEEESEMIKMISELMFYSGFAFELDVENDMIRLDGYTSINDTINSYFRLLQTAGESSITIPGVLPERTALMIHAGFDSFDKLYSEIDKVLQSDPESYENYQDDKHKIEKFLDISVEEHLMSWIDDELALVQIHPGGLGDDNEFAIVIKAKSQEQASQNLRFIEKRIRKKTPVKFKQITYKGYPINFLSMKGLFKPLFGRLFRKLEKPYYTIVDDYVIFSNHPLTLRDFINDHNLGKSLADTPEYNEYMQNFSSSSSLMIYANIHFLVEDSKQWLTRETISDMKPHEDYFKSFPRIGMQVRPERTVAHTSLFIEFEDLETANAWNRRLMAKDDFTISAKPPDTAKINLGPTEAVDSFQFVVQHAELNIEEEILSLDEVSPDELDANKHQEFYDNGQLKLEVHLKDGLKHGTVREYSLNGHLIVKGRYRNDQKDGTWRFYDEEGNLLEKRRFKDGQEVN